MRLEYHPEIEHDLRKIINFYDDRSSGLGKQFLDEFEKQVLNITSMPSRWLVVEGNVRRSLMKRFPYVIYFRALEQNILRVTAVKHQRRHPDYALSRK